MSIFGHTQYDESRGFNFEIVAVSRVQKSPMDQTRSKPRGLWSRRESLSFLIKDNAALEEHVGLCSNPHPALVTVLD